MSKGSLFYWMTCPVAWKLLDVYGLAETAVVSNSHTCLFYIQSHIHCANSCVTFSFSHWYLCYPAATPRLGKTLLGRGRFNSPSRSFTRLVRGAGMSRRGRGEGALTFCRHSVFSFFLFRHLAAAILFLSRRLFFLSSSSGATYKIQEGHV